MQLNILTSVPDYFSSVLTSSILGRAKAHGHVQITILNLRDYADGRRKKIVDDEPYGGGAGQIIKIEPIARALDHLRCQGTLGCSYLTSARGTPFSQATARAWSSLPYLTLICGHYEGVDERVVSLVDGVISLGQFVLTGGEPAAAAMIDAVVRLIPGVLGNADSLCEESFNAQTCEYPQYTRPRVFQGLRVPDVLLSGDHAAIKRWRAAHSLPIRPSK